MLAFKFLFMILGLGLFFSAGIVVAYDVYMAGRLRWLLEQASADPATPAKRLESFHPFGPVRWRLARHLALAGIVPVLLSLSVAVVPDGCAGIRVSQLFGARPATLYLGLHLLTPLVDTLVLYDTREQVYTTTATATAQHKTPKRP